MKMKAKMKSLEITNATLATAQAIAKAANIQESTQRLHANNNLRISILEKSINKQEQKSNEIINLNKIKAPTKKHKKSKKLERKPFFRVDGLSRPYNTEIQTHIKSAPKEKPSGSHNRRNGRTRTRENTLTTTASPQKTKAKPTQTRNAEQLIHPLKENGALARQNRKSDRNSRPCTKHATTTTANVPTTSTPASTTFTLSFPILYTPQWNESPLQPTDLPEPADLPELRSIPTTCFCSKPFQLSTANTTQKYNEQPILKPTSSSKKLITKSKSRRIIQRRKKRYNKTNILKQKLENQNSIIIKRTKNQCLANFGLVANPYLNLRQNFNKAIKKPLQHNPSNHIT
jgi:hypothetical protein